jgi:hypothetical protein
MAMTYAKSSGCGTDAPPRHPYPISFFFYKAHCLLGLKKIMITKYTQA